jgi:1-acyl-sn-glycerol-3-phosphate acyltransferase
LRALVNAKVFGEENVEGLEGAFILIPNHTSHLDAPMVFSLLPDFLTERLATGAAADYFYRRKGVAEMTSLFFNTYPIERKGKPRAPGQPNAAGMTGRLLRAGVPILVFPEGTRSRSGELGVPKPGAAALAQKVGVPLVPIAMAGGHEAMPVGKLVPRFRSKVALYIGRPMHSREGARPEDFSCAEGNVPFAQAGPDQHAATVKYQILHRFRPFALSLWSSGFRVRLHRRCSQQAGFSPAVGPPWWHG